jgi:hypothetical protein
VFGARSVVFWQLDVFDLGLVGDGALVFAPAALATTPLLPPTDEPSLTHVENRALSRGPAKAEAAVPSVASRVRVTSTSLAVDVVNPRYSYLKCDILIGVWPRTATTYDLQTDDGQARSVTVPSTAVPQWTRFAGVTLPPGTTHITVSAPPTIDRRLAAFMPPRFVVDAKQQPHVDQIEFANVTARLVVTNSVASRDSSAGRGFAVNASAADDPGITVHPKQATSPGSTDWALDVSVRGIAYFCFVHFDDDTRFDLDDGLRACLRGEGRSLTLADQDQTAVLGLWILRRYGDVSLASASIDSTRDVIPTHLADYRERPLASTSLPLSLGTKIVLGQASLAHAEDITTSEAYSPTWVAWETGRGFAFLPHREALIWRNVWRVSAPGTVYVVNWLVLAQELLALVGLLVVILAWRRR